MRTIICQYHIVLLYFVLTRLDRLKMPNKEKTVCYFYMAIEYYQRVGRLSICM